MKQDHIHLFYLCLLFANLRYTRFVLFTTESYQRSISFPSQNSVQIHRIKTLDSYRDITFVIIFAVLTLQHWKVNLQNLFCLAEGPSLEYLNSDIFIYS